MHVLVTGGAGYIGSHAALRLIEEGHVVTVVDNLSRGNRSAIDTFARVAAERDPENETSSDTHSFQFFELDVNETHALTQVLTGRGVEAVMHFAALAYVGESVEEPLRYYRSNAAGTLALLEACDAAEITRFIFSSTCATYGEPAPEHIPIREDFPQRPINPYGRAKLMAEHMLRDYFDLKRNRGEPFSYASLRYFNVAGADPKGRIGEIHDPQTHLIPIALQTAAGKRASMSIFGSDYNTPDGTCVRDYVHVCDLVDAHLVVLEALDAGGNESRTYNLGIGRGYSVREVIEAAKQVTGIDFRVADGPRRAGDPPVLYADPAKIERDLGWRARVRDIETMIADAWRFMQR